MTRSLRALLLTVGAIVPAALAVVGMSGAFSPLVPPAADGGRDGPREILIRAHAWGFSPSVVHVKPGQTVRFVVESEDIRHGFALNELNMNLPLFPGRQARSPALAVDLPEGTYAIHCSTFCGLGHPAMKAKLIVGAPGPSPGVRAPWVASALAVAAVVALGLVARGGRGRGA